MDLKKKGISVTVQAGPLPNTLIQRLSSHCKSKRSTNHTHAMRISQPRTTYYSIMRGKR